LLDSRYLSASGELDDQNLPPGQNVIEYRVSSIVDHVL